MDDLDKFVDDHIRAETARVGIACIKTSSVEIAEVAAMLDSEAIHACIQAFCLGAAQGSLGASLHTGNDLFWFGADHESIGKAFSEAVLSSLGMVAENNLIKKFEQGEK